jgi:Flp pilus assembly pilin Flp
MHQVRLFLDQFSADEDGATALEYSLICAAIGFTIAASIFAFGDSVKRVLYDAFPGIFDSVKPS